jgi:protein SCO1
MSTLQPPPQTEPAGDGPPPEPSGQRRRGGLDPRIPLALVTIVVIVAGVTLLSTGGSSSRPRAGSIQGVSSQRYDGSLAQPAAPVPALSLRNYKGEAVNIKQYRGKAVLVTFLYTHCPDVCPIIASNLGVALKLMGPAQAARTQVIAVSVDPRGDTPKTVARFLATHLVTGRMQYLIGSLHELAPTWKAWYVGSERDAEHPELVNHTGLVYGVSASGKITTLYASSFTPSEIAHDARLLASS